MLLDQVDAESVAAIYRHGGGNPFYLEQLGGRRRGEDLPRRSHGRRVEARRARRGQGRDRRGAGVALGAFARSSSTPRPSPASRSSRISRP